MSTFLIANSSQSKLIIGGITVGFEVKCIKNESVVNGITLHQNVYFAEAEVNEFNPVWFSEKLPSSIKHCYYYKSGWGNEFRRVREEVGKELKIESLLGRSSAQFHPYIVLEDTNGRLFSYQIFYSGNWKIFLEKCCEGFELKIGFEEEFQTSINSSDSFTTPIVGSFSTEKGWADLRGTWQFFVQNWMNKNDLFYSVPVAWNHWWAYEDFNINEEVFLGNVKRAAEIGVDIIILDAGWFGNKQHWFDVRGDWSDVDKSKFPNGIRYLSDKVHEAGMKFGLWIEIEGLGKLSNLAKEHADFVAKKDGNFLDYLCFGNEEVVNWAIKTVSYFIEEYGCEWIKFDFNLDPVSCDCTSHGHGKNDGLYYHYVGLYRFFEELNKEYPEVVFENCSSGGLRFDLGILKYMHCSFLSDPDYPTHKERCIKNAGEFMPPSRMFHFMPSQTCETNGPRPFLDSSLTLENRDTWKYMTRLGMLTSFGISHRLVDYSQEVIDFFKEEISIFKEKVKPFIKSATYHFEDSGALSIHIYKKENETLLMFFLNGHQDIYSVKLVDLDMSEDKIIDIEDIDSGVDYDCTSHQFDIDFREEKAKAIILREK